MALADADFAWRYPVGDTAIALECDGRTCYAYVGIDEPPFLGSVWLFNLADAPEAFAPPEDGQAPMNSRGAARPFTLDEEVRPEAFSVEAVEREGRREIAIRYAGTLVGALWEGAWGGYSTFATADSPVASPFPTPWP